MAKIDIIGKCDFISFFIENNCEMGIECLVDINFVDVEDFNETMKLGFDPTKWEEKFPYSKILIEGKHYSLIT